ncbi:hypothetical protein [Paraburkholderia phosphatilytica]|uniref:hypothetical protein n=1 Tax=Paraburkholderia phosphatilytica TaxID=2282883 RepID=UPI000F5FAA22|nr:hypothetical protein [Paraburkholderia phosphatilytica]
MLDRQAVFIADRAGESSRATCERSFVDGRLYWAPPGCDRRRVCCAHHAGLRGGHVPMRSHRSFRQLREQLGGGREVQPRGHALDRAVSGRDSIIDRREATL